MTQLIYIEITDKKIYKKRKKFLVLKVKFLDLSYQQIVYHQMIIYDKENPTF